MKKFSLFFFVISSFVFMNSFADEGQSKLMQVGITNAFVPAGFDSNSEVYVIVSGVFPNGCYKWSHADVTHIDNFTHEIKSMADVHQGMCIMVLVPFTKEVKLGKFSPGDHSLKFLNGDGTYIQKKLNIER